MVAGIDIGGTKIRWVIFDGSKIVLAKEIRTPLTKELFLDVIKKISLDLAKRNVMRVGIGSAGVVSGSRILRARNLSAILPVDMAALFGKKFTIKVDNDARCFARAETTLGKKKYSGRVLVIALGTGIGRALVVGGKAVPIKKFETAESWEKEYQRRSRERAGMLGPFVAKHVLTIIRAERPDVIIFGGGRLRTKDLFRTLRSSLKKEGVATPIERSRFRGNSAAIGAALLV